MWCQQPPQARAEAGEADRDEVGEVVGDALSHAVALRVEVREAREPAGVEVERVGPRVQRALAVEVLRRVGHGGELVAGRQEGLGRAAVAEALRVVRGGARLATGAGACRVLGAPLHAPSMASRRQQAQCTRG